MEIMLKVIFTYVRTHAHLAGCLEEIIHFFVHGDKERVLTACVITHQRG
jgi:hypothetical protein